MALYDLAPQSASMAMVQNNAFRQIFSTVKLSDGTAVNLGTPNAARLNIFPSGGAAGGTALAALTPTLTCLSGTAQLDLTAAQTAAIVQGNYQFVLSAKDLVGDDYQVIASGSVSISPDA